MDSDFEKQEVQVMITEAIKMHRHDGVLTQLVYLSQLFGFRPKWQDNLDLGETSIARATTGTTPVPMFETSILGTTPFPFTVHAVYVISNDTTAGNIILKNGSSTVCTIAKGTVAGVMVGAPSLSSASYVSGAVCTIQSSSAGNATLIMHIEFPDN